MNATDELIRLDGSTGEGGGQILRSALALSMLTGRPFAIDNIRARRKKPGLMRQHLTAAQAAARIANAEIVGASLASSRLEFRPGSVAGGHFEFAVGTAGSTMLILQTILLPLCLAAGESEVRLNGGTHNPLAPPFPFIDHAFLPIARRMGFAPSVALQRPGYFPAGGGQIIAHCQGSAQLCSMDLLERGPLRSRYAYAIANNLPENIADRELKVARDRLGFSGEELHKDASSDASGPGNVFFIVLEFEHITEVFTGFGEQGKTAEKVAHEACDQAERYLKSDVPVGDYLADQLLLPLAVVGGGSFRCTALTPHFTTNAEVIQRFLPVTIQTEREDRLAWRVTIQS